MPPPIDYRQTFLRHHVPTELDPPFVQKPGFREEILALDSLRQRLQQTFPTAAEEIHHLASRRRFFETMPDDKPWLYLPVGVRPLPAGDRGISVGERDEYDNLTDLLCHTAKERRSVLLTARSGAGKSTAMLKAFFDCLIDRDPPLGGYLPCYLRSFSKARKENFSGHEIILDLLAEASRLPSRPSKDQIEQWLNYSPPLLLFVDLNTATDKLRSLLAEAMIRFQEHYEGKHHWIVAYRAADRDTALMNLQQSNWFGTYDLLPLQYEDALKYLRNLQRVENEVANKLAGDGLPAANRPATAAILDAEALRRLFDRYGNHPESLISTPLLMHFVSLIGIERATSAESLAQLYAEVVEDYLDRDYGNVKGKATTPYREIVSGSGLMNPKGRTKLKVAMVRVALAILAGSVTRLQPPKDAPEDTAVEEMLDDLFSEPEEYRDPDWWPADDWWHKGRYYTEPFDPPACRALREFSFLRRDGDTIGFLHDSFLYYFAALAVRCRRVPQLGRRSSLKAKSVRSEWCRKAVERMHQAPGAWRQPALFLGGMLSPDELQALLPPLLTAEPVAGWFGVTSQMLRGRRRTVGEDDVVLRQVERALASRSTELNRYPEALFPYVYNHLSWCEEPQAACHTFADGMLRPTMNATGRPWLRAETPMPPLREQVFRCDSEVRCLAIYAQEQFVTGHKDGTVRHWRVQSGECKILYRHGGRYSSVLSLAVDAGNGAVVSGGADRTVRRWRPGEGEAEILYRDEHVVLSVAVDGRDGSVVMGGYDGRVRRWRPGEGDAEILYQHERGVLSVAVDGRDGSVLSGGQDCSVRRWRPGESDAEILYWHDGWVWSVAVDGRDGSVLSGGQDCSVRRWRPGESDAEILYWHDGWVWSVAVDGRDGSVLSGGRDRMVRRWRPRRGNAEILSWHEHEVHAVAVDARNGTVLWGGADRTVRRWRLGDDDAKYLYSPEYWASSVAVDGRDGSVLSLDSGTVRRWRPGEGKAEILYRHDRGALSVGVDGRDGSVLSVDSDGMVRRWRPGEGDAKILYEPENWLWSVAVNSRDGSVLSAGSDGTVRRRRPGEGEAEILYRHEGRVWSVSVDARDGSVLSGGSDGRVRRWRPGEGEAEILYQHEGWVLSVSVVESADGLFSGGDDCNLRLFRFALRAYLMLLTPYWIHSIACSLMHNRIAIALGDGRLVLVRVEPSVEALISYPGVQKNPPPDASTQ